MAQLVPHNPHPSITRGSLSSLCFSLEERGIAGGGSRWLRASSWAHVNLDSRQNDFLVQDYRVHCLHVRGGGRWEVTHSRHVEHNTECQDVALPSPQSLMLWSLYSSSRCRSRGSILDHIVWNKAQPVLIQPAGWVKCPPQGTRSGRILQMKILLCQWVLETFLKQNGLSLPSLPSGILFFPFAVLDAVLHLP